MSEFASYLDAQFVQAKIKEVTEPMYFQIKIAPFEDQWGLQQSQMAIPENERSIVIRSEVDLLAESFSEEDMNRLLISRGFVENAKKLMKRNITLRREKGVLQVLVCASKSTPHNGRVFLISRAKAPK